MNKKKISFIISAVLIILAIVFTILVKTVDVKPVGVNETQIGFSSINKPISEALGSNMTLYKITEYLGYVAILIVPAYALIGGIELIKRKSLFKVDKEIMVLGGFYAVIFALYLFFEKVIINYRPVLLEGELEASYPSSHTLMSICFCISAIIINNKLFKNNITKYINIILVILMIAIVFGRFVSGVHWFTDIIGGITISSALLMSFYSLINLFNKNDKKVVGKRFKE